MGPVISADKPAFNEWFVLGINQQFIPVCLREGAVFEQDFAGDFVEAGQAFGFGFEEHFVFGGKDIAVAVAVALEGGFDLFLHIGGQAGIFLVELQVVAVFGSQGRFGDIAVVYTLNALAHLPAELGTHFDKGVKEVFGMKDGHDHMGRRGALAAFDFLPHHAAASIIGHQYNIRKYL